MTLWQIWGRLEEKGGLLYWQALDPTRRDPVLQFLVPRALREVILQEVHAGRLSGHLGVIKTLGRLKDRMYWPGMRRDVERWCNICLPCSGRKPRPGPRCQPMGHLDVGDQMERVAMDILEPDTITARGNHYILVFVECFTRWTEA